MGFFNNVKNIKDKALESGYIQEIEELQGVFDKIDEQADIERENKRAEREHFESLSIDETVEYKRIQGKRAKGIPAKKPREYFKISYDNEGHPKVSTLVDVDPYNLEERYEMLMREV